MTKKYPIVINHVGVSVTNINRAVNWYKKIFGFIVLKGPLQIPSDDPETGAVFQKIFPSFKSAKVAWLTSGGSVGFEIFEFENPKAEKMANNFEYWKTGFFHICVTDPNIYDLRKKISANKGKLKGGVLTINKSRGHKLAYCEDPFGNIIEIFSHGYEQFIAKT